MPFMDSEAEKLRAHLQEVAAHFLKQIADWKVYGKRAEAQAQRLIDKNRELTARVAELEEQMRDVIRNFEPHNRRLFQSPHAIKKSK